MYIDLVPKKQKWGDKEKELQFIQFSLICLKEIWWIVPQILVKNTNGFPTKRKRKHGDKAYYP